jgi:hypothetical protein
MILCCVLLDNCLMRFQAFFAVMRFSDKISCFLLHIYHHKMLVSRYVCLRTTCSTWRDVNSCSSGSRDRSGFRLVARKGCKGGWWDMLRRGVVRFGRKRFPDEMSCFLALYEISSWDRMVFCCRVFLRDLLKRFLAFLPLRDVLLKFVAFCCILHLMRYSDELFWAITNFLYEISFLFCRRFIDGITCFLAAEFSFWWCAVRTVERWMLKDAGERVYTMIYWTWRGFVCLSWMVRWLGKWM